MRRTKLTSSLLALGASTTLFAGIAFAADLSGMNSLYLSRLKANSERPSTP